MGKKRSQRKRHHNASRRYMEFVSQRNVEAILVESERRQEKSEYQRMVAKLEADVLCRTVFVTNARDLRQPANLDRLKTFLERTYGPVERCERTSYGGRNRRNGPSYPPARVRMATKAAAERMFGGAPLARAKATDVSCPGDVCGRGGTIRVQPSKRCDGMADDQLKGDILCLDVQSLSLGHWCPDDHDAFVQFLQEDNFSGESQEIENCVDEFVEELSIQCQPGVKLSMSINLVRRCVEVVSKSSATPPVATTNETSLLPSIMNELFKDAAKPGDHVISFRFKEMRSHMKAYRTNDGDYNLIFALKWPPKLYHGSLGINGQRTRHTKFLNAIGGDFGECRAFKVVLTESSMQMISYHTVLPKLCKFGVFAKDFQHGNQHNEIVVKNIEGCRMNNKRDFEAEMNRVQSSCHPEIGFLLRALVDNGRCSWYHLLHGKISNTRAEHNLACLLSSERTSITMDPSRVIKTLERILSSESPGCTKYPCHLFMQLAGLSNGEMAVAENRNESIPDYCVRVPRLLLSPCQARIIEVGIEMSNRVLRKFIHSHDFGACSFVRLQVGDETGHPLFGEWSQEVQDRMVNTLLDGIVVNGLTYSFLAYSSSQLKESSLWLVHGRKSSAQVRALLGDFSNCQTASKWAARVGQCFSTTVDCKVAGFQITSPAVVPDIASLSGKEHSDGTGIVTRRLFDEMCKDLPFSSDPRDFSIVQIRFGGAKGTLSAWDNFEHFYHCHLQKTKKDVVLRNSMKKFNSPYERIEVCSVGTTVPYYLNRFVILLLTVHGVPDQIFLSLQKEMIDRLDSMLTKIEVAVELLPSLSGPDSGLVSFLLHMLYSGWSPDADPFLFNALHAIRQHHLFALRKKARVFVKEGAVLMGGLDETGLLKDGEVFVQVSKWDPSNPGKLVHKIITGLVMVTKHPALHTGDVRMLRAVDVPQLQGQRNVILFSQHGDRPEADKMSGSDLDGDQFAVTWDDRLFLQGPNHSPLDFDNLISTKSSLMPSNTSEHDRALVQHFVNHVMNDNVGRIAMLWLDYASKYGANCNKCVELARLHSIAVDFPKSGIPANVPRELILPPDFKVGHWREAKGRASEHCDSIIGRMYDQVIGRDKDSAFLYSKSALAARKIDSYGRIISWFESTEQGKNALQDIYRDDVPSSLGLDAFSVPEKELYLEMAAEMYGEYEGDIRTLMNKYTIQSEGELFTGCIRKYHKLHKKKQFSIAEEVRRSCRELRKEYRQWFFDCVLNFVGGPPELNQDSHDPREISEDEGEILDRIEVAAACISLETVQSMSEWEIEVRRFAFALAAVCYLTTYSPDRVVTRGKSALFGLPWLVADVIHAGLDDFASRNQ